MNAPIDSLLVLMVLTMFLLLGSSRLVTCIKVTAVQGVLIGLLPLAEGEVTWRVASIAVAIVLLKGLLVPYMLLGALRESDTSREVKPYIGYTASIFVGLSSLIASFWMDARLVLPVGAPSDLVVPVSFSLMITGLFLIVARRTAINQVVGYLVLEGGIYTFGLAVVRDVPLLVELGVLMDLFVGVFVMGIAIYRINREFDHIDSDRLSELKG